MDIGQKIHIRLPGPSMGYTHHSLQHIFSRSSFDSDLSPVRLNDNWISIFDPKFFSGFCMNLCIGFWVLLLKALNVSVLGMSIIEASGAGCKNQGESLKQLGIAQRALVWFSVGGERVKPCLFKGFRIDLYLF